MNKPEFYVAFYKIFKALREKNPFLSSRQAAAIAKYKLFKRYKEERAKIEFTDEEWENMLSRL